MLPSRQKAIELIADAEIKNPGPWVKHCYTAADCAEKISKACGLDSEKAYVLGLLHDIGRYNGIYQFKHVLDGYEYMKKLGYDEVARVCLSHSFATHDIDEYIGNIDASQEEFLMLKDVLNNMQYDDYDRLIQLCDCLAGDKVVDMSQRMDDVEKRYGNYPKVKRDKNMELKAYFEAKCGKNIYRIVCEDESLWGK